MRSRAMFENIPTGLTDQLSFLMKEILTTPERAVEYVRSKDFAVARGFSDELTEKQVIREMHAVIRHGAG